MNTKKLILFYAKTLIISAPEVAQIMVCSENYARQILRDIREHLGKPKNHRVSRRQFALYFDYNLDDINRALDGPSKPKA